MSSLENFDATVLGERLRLARSAAGKTQEAAAAAIGVARTTLVAIERGDRRVRPHELVALARAYDTTVNSLVRPRSVHVDAPVQFRQHGASGTELSEAISILNRVATSYVELERAVDRPLRVHVGIPEFALSRGAALPQAEDAASQLRGLLGLGLSPIPDLLSVAESQMTLRVVMRRLPSRVAGAYLFHQELGGCILLNSNHPRPRRVWTLAHEIGHFVSERSTPHVAVLDGKDSDDAFADAFAGALLMPPAALRRRFAEIAATSAKFSPRDLIQVAHEFHVSIEAMCRWLERLGLLPKQTYEALRERGLDGSVVRSVVGDPPPDAPTPVPARLMAIVAEAYERKLVTEGQLVEMLGLDRLALRELLDSIPTGDLDVVE